MPFEIFWSFSQKNKTKKQNKKKNPNNNMNH